MSDVMMIVIGTMVVTYLPRLLPFIMISDKPLPAKALKFLEYLPYAALGALIIPGAFNAIPNAPLAGGGGLIFAAVYSYKKSGITISVVGGILATYMILILI